MEIQSNPDKIVITSGDVVLRFERSVDAPNPQFWNVYFGKKNIGYIAGLAIFGGSKNWTCVAPMFFEDGVDHMIFQSFTDAQGWIFTEAAEALS